MEIVEDLDLHPHIRYGVPFFFFKYIHSGLFLASFLKVCLGRFGTYCSHLIQLHISVGSLRRGGGTGRTLWEQSWRGWKGFWMELMGLVTGFHANYPLLPLRFKRTQRDAWQNVLLSSLVDKPQWRYQLWSIASSGGPQWFYANGPILQFMLTLIQQSWRK